ncbi:MAG: hypothetical protein IKT43_01225 [Clostridia bacterium]|nr:hypothetical protein [Clostridia bacterium]
MNTIADLSEMTIIKQSHSMVELRKNINILIIDDNSFYAEDFLKANGYQITHKNDIDSIRDVEPYEIIMCDIAGVGKKLGYEKEGAFIIREIHANYPSKQIVAYTANTYNADYNQFFSLADYVATKDLGIDDWIDVLDSQIKEAINPIHRWEKIRSYLLNNGVSTITIARIEDKFVQSINKKNFNALQNFVEEKDSKLRTIITDFTSSLCAKLILGLVGGAQ